MIATITPTARATRYQYMYGPSFLVAPVYQNTAADKEGNDVRNGIYLPKGTWYDYFTGATYEGGCIHSTRLLRTNLEVASLGEVWVLSFRWSIR